MMADLVIILLVPVGVGQLARLAAPLRLVADRYKPVLGVASRLLILAIMLKAAASVSAELGAHTASLSLGLIALTGVLCLGNHLLALFGGIWTSRWFGFDRASQIAVGFSGSQKTLPVSLALLELYFKQYPLAVVPLLFYHAGQLIVDTFIADQWVSGGAREASHGLGNKPDEPF
jgi:sodium/bile acid cotransporter 7